MGCLVNQWCYLLLLRVVFFNQPYRAGQLPEGTEASFFGRVEMFRGRRQMTNPVVDVVFGCKTHDIVH